jgi:hypothetical protein
MRLSAPKFMWWVVSAVLGVIGLLGSLGVVPALAGLSFWAVLIGLALLLLATAMKGM